MMRSNRAGSPNAYDLWETNADPAQVESALLNLAVNARDAMPDGGSLIIETANVTLDGDYAKTQLEVTAGAYVMLSVTDTGAGMSAEVQEHAFEPFFTTKEVGQGTGLGLSMVFGFAKQSGGHVVLNSEAGVGTTVKLYLPRAAQLDNVVVERNGEAPSAQGESILLVEDDEDLRILVTSMLRKLGYQYTVAENGDAAIAAMSTLPKIDLLVSDIVLPGGKSGPDIAVLARRRFPDVKVLFMSGYPRGALSGPNQVDENVLLLEKPFRMADLARNIREALGTA
jgi:CheY-like chemotaxis protein